MSEPGRHPLRHRTAELLEANRPDDPLGHGIDLALITLILANVVAIILETVPAYGQRFDTFFYRFEVFSVAVFSIEYLLRLWSCVDREHGMYRRPVIGRLKWMVSPLGLVDLVAIAPFYLLMFVDSSAVESLLILRLVRGIRLIRLFKLARYSPALRILRNVLIAQGPTLAVATFIMGIILIIASWGIYVMEKDAQPEAFRHIPAAMWWAVVTLTTVGYGDVVPLTTGGKLFAGVIGLIGVGMMALPAGILASGFSTELKRRTDTYNRALELALHDGVISEFEEERLEALQEQLGLNKEEAQRLLVDARRRLLRSLASSDCPHCGEPLIPTDKQG